MYKFENWHVAFRNHVDDIETNKDDFIVIPNTIRYWAADPFIIYKDNSYYIFAELYDRINSKGKIGYCRLSNDGKIIDKWRVIINSKVHLSFPVPIIKDDKVYIMPESSKENQVRIYESTEFPIKWKIKKIIINNQKLCDSILIDSDFLLTYDNNSNPKLSILFKKNENGSYEKVSSECDYKLCFRPGGNVFFNRDKLILPFQNCYGEYGKSIFFTEIIIDENRLKTNVLFEISPEKFLFKNFKKNIIGTHTYNFTKNIEVIDIKTREFNFISLLGLIKNRLFRG